MTSPDQPDTLSIESLQKRIYELEHLLADRDERLEAANRELEDLVQFISHDLRAPLRGVDGYSQALLEDYEKSVDELGKAYLGFIRDSSRMASALIDRMLIYSRAMRRPVEAEMIDLSHLAEHVTGELLGKQPERDIQLEIAPHLSACADQRMTQTLLEELFGNAIKFTAARPHAVISLTERREAGERILVLKDNGAGFNPAYANKLFKPFERLHNVNEFPGAGLGLAISKRIVERQGGRIWAEGAVDQGATFYFTYPEPEAA